MSSDSQGNATKLVHNVYFKLSDSSDAAIARLIAGCREHLTGHPGTVFFAVGTLADYSRPVNDRDFDVALHVVFDGRGSHDQYQTHPRHLKFVEEHKPTWSKVRVFDSDAS